VAILVPTTILAEQHYQNFRQRIGAFPIRTEMLSRFKTAA
jgi:transcription-repair coupling factor (superfamily II helicase)